MPIPVATCELLGTFIEAIAFGVYLMVSPECLRVTLRKNIGTPLKIYLLITMGLLFICAVLHICVDLTRVFEAFTSKMDIAGSPEAYFANVDTVWNLTKNSAYTSATIVADLLLVYRTFVVWGRNYWIAVGPFLILIVDFAMSVWFTASVDEAKPGHSVLVSAAISRARYFFIATLVLNIICTGLISFRIWRIQSQVVGFKSSKRSTNAISIIVESAAVYSALTTILLILSATQQSAWFFFLNSMPPLIGIVFSYVILRCSADDRRKYDTTTFTTRFGGSTLVAGQSQKHQSAAPPPDGVHISLHKIVHRDEVDMEMQCGSATFKEGRELTECEASFKEDRTFDDRV